MVLMSPHAYFFGSGSRDGQRSFGLRDSVDDVEPDSSLSLSPSVLQENLLDEQRCSSLG